jgi:hypothetical protein
MQCTRCDYPYKLIPITDWLGTTVDYHYCPSCGAKCDSEEEQEQEPEDVES